MTKNSPPSVAVLLAGGRGTRFWPRSRTRTPKQLLNIVGRKTMLGETVGRIRPLFDPKNVWVVTTEEQAAAVRRELPRLPSSHVLVEPVGRNTAAAIGLAAIHLKRECGDAVMAVLPADHHISQTTQYRRLVGAALELARVPGALVVLGIPPTRPETGFGYIERGGAITTPSGARAYGVRRFTEKPPLRLAKRYVASGRHFWNAGMFFWRVSTFFENLEEFLPRTADALAALADRIGTHAYAAALKRIYPRLESISVDYAILQPATRQRRAPRVFLMPAKVGWSDIGSWAAVYELLVRRPGENVSAGKVVALDAMGNYFWCPEKVVAAIGVRDLILVETRDAVLLCPRQRAQEVGQVVKRLEQERLRRLL